jgi:hypothetical protein
LIDCYISFDVTFSIERGEQYLEEFWMSRLSNECV